MTLQLVDEGKLKLTDTVDKFFPKVPNADKITIVHLLSHRSGIPSSRPESKTNAVTREQLLEIIASGKPEFEPGEKHGYSNSGYLVLGLIIEKITGKSYEEGLKERISSKIGLKNTYSPSGDIDPGKKETHAFSHFGGNWKQQTETHGSILFGGGQIVSTPYEMAMFIHGLFGGKLISEQSLKLMMTLKDGEGLGMTSFKFAGKTFYGETGGGDNRGAWLAYEPEEKLAVAYATNAKIYPVTNIVSGVVDIYYNKPFKIPALESLALDPELLDKYVGNYSTPGAPAPASITRDGATLYFQPPGAAGAAGSAPLEAVAENKFQIEGAAVFTFDPAKSQMTIKRRGGERVFTKVR